MTLFEHDALYYAQQLRQGTVSVTSLIERALSNIAQLNPRLNAVSVVQDEYARELARQYDTQFAKMTVEEREQLPTFWGVPLLLKDLGQHQKGQISTEGSTLFQQARATRTDNFVQAIEKLGFIVVGRTNTPEFGFKNVSDSQANGAVNSPFDSQRNAGGSSGGAGAALKAGIVPIVTASDGGGSIRIPASFNGLIGLKTSRGRIPVGPSNYRGWQGASVNFALTKSVRDTWALLKGLQAEQLEAPFNLSMIEEQELQALTRPLRIAYTLEAPYKNTVHTEAQQAVMQTVEYLRSKGHTVEQARPNVNDWQTIEDYTVMNGVETTAMFDNIERALGTPIQKDDVELMTWAMYQLGLSISGREYSQLLSRWDQLSVLWHNFLTEEYDIMLTPSTNGPATMHDYYDLSPEKIHALDTMEEVERDERLRRAIQMFEKGWQYTGYNYQQNLTGQPAISLPVHHTQDGLPLGIQCFASKGQEYLLLQLAQQFEQDGKLFTHIHTL